MKTLPTLMVKPHFPALRSSPHTSLKLRRQEGYDRQAGPTHWLFQEPPAESKFLAISQQPSNNMLLQPPERTISEVEAQIAAQYPQKHKVNKFFRFFVYATPTFAAPISYFLFAGVLEQSRGLFIIPVHQLCTKGGILLMLAVIYSIGLFDAQLSHEVRLSPAEQRRRKVLKHALKFTLFQLIIIPCGLAAFCVAIVFAACFYANITQ